MCQVFPFTLFVITRSLVEPFLFNLPRKKNIVVDRNEPSRRLLLLNQTISSHSLDTAPEPIRNLIQNRKGVRVTNYTVELDYNYYTASEVFSNCVFDLGFLQSAPTDMHAPCVF